MHHRKRISLLVALAATTLLPTLATAAEAWPSSPIRLVVPLAAGGISDVMARTVAEEMGKSLGTSVIVENKPGANFFIGIQSVTTSKPDGYTLAYLPSSALTLSPIHYKDRIPYKVSDLQLLSTLFRGHQLLAVSKSAPYNTLAEFIADSRKRDTPILLGTSSVGGSTHLMVEQLASVAGLKVQPVVYKGEPPAVQDLIAGNLPVFSGVLPSLLEHYRSGNIKLLAISSEQRVAGIPAVPTFKEQGYPMIGTTYWAGLAAPAGTPADVVEKLHKAVVAAVQSQAFRNRLQPDMEPFTTTPGAFQEMVKSESARWEQLIRDRKITVQ